MAYQFGKIGNSRLDYGGQRVIVDGKNLLKVADEIQVQPITKNYQVILNEIYRT